MMLPDFYRIKSNVLKNRILIENFSFLSILHITNLILFLITIPYLFRVLGSRLYGLIVFAQALVVYFSIFINFGFNLTATRDISVNRNNPVKISEIVSSVLTLKIILYGISLFLMYLFTVFIPYLKEHRNLFLFSMLFCLNEALFPVWYFMGIEKMKYITFINASTRVISTIAVFILIKSSVDYILYPLIMGSGTVIGAFIALLLVFTGQGIRFSFQEFKILKSYFLENILYFLSNVSTQIYANANKLIVGSFLGMVEVAYYDIAEKVINILKVPYSLLGQTIFPKYSHDKNIRFLKKIFFITMILTLALISCLFMFSHIIVYALSGTYDLNTVKVLRVLSLTMLPISISIFYGEIMLIGNNKKLEYAKMRFWGLLVYFGIFLYLKISGHLNALNIALMLVISEFFIAVYAFLISRINGYDR